MPLSPPPKNTKKATTPLCNEIPNPAPARQSRPQLPGAQRRDDDLDDRADRPDRHQPQQARRPALREGDLHDNPAGPRAQLPAEHLGRRRRRHWLQQVRVARARRVPAGEAGQAATWPGRARDAQGRRGRRAAAAVPEAEVRPRRQECRGATEV